MNTPLHALARHCQCSRGKNMRPTGSPFTTWPLAIRLSDAGQTSLYAGKLSRAMPNAEICCKLFIKDCELSQYALVAQWARRCVCCYRSFPPEAQLSRFQLSLARQCGRGSLTYDPAQSHTYVLHNTLKLQIEYAKYARTTSARIPGCPELGAAPTSAFQNVARRGSGLLLSAPPQPPAASPGAQRARAEQARGARRRLHGSSWGSRAQRGSDIEHGNQWHAGGAREGTSEYRNEAGNISASTPFPARETR